MKEEKTIKAYKAFEKDMTCRDFQYEVGKEYEMDGKSNVAPEAFTLASLRLNFSFTMIYSDLALQR